jgi:hypothetical protein
MSTLVDFIHPNFMTKDYGYYTYYCEDLIDYGDKKILVLGRVDSQERGSLFIPGFLKQYNIGKTDFDEIVSKVLPIPTIMRKDIEFFLRNEGYGTSEDMYFLNNEVEVVGSSLKTPAAIA